MRAIILAAGRGTRFDPTSGSTKALIRVGSRSLIEHSILCLQMVGITKIIVVTGYGSAELEDSLYHYRPFVQTIFNPEYESTGTARSLMYGSEGCCDEVLCLECDLIFELKALTAILGTGQGTSALVTNISGSSDEVFVTANHEGKIIGMSKNRKGLTGHVIGEFVGISKLSGNDLRRLSIFAATMEGRDAAYDIDYFPKLGSVGCISVPDLLWSEIDTHAHLQRVNAVIFPQILVRAAEDGTAAFR